MQVTLTRVGNSVGLRIPHPVLSSLGLRAGDRLFLATEGNRLVLSRSADHPVVREFMEAVRPMLGREVALVYLFGSFTTPKFRPGRSDIDLYIAVKRLAARAEVCRRAADVSIRARLRGLPPLGPVVVGLKDADWGWFQCEVARGVPLYVDYEAFPDGPPKSP